MIANILIIVFLLAMLYWWALQGFFSAFLHLMLVIISGAIAFAIWEPLVFSFGMSMQPTYSWGLWLLGPFVLLLIILRVVTDRVIKKNVQFPTLVNNGLGAVCGVISGLLTAGVAMIGVSFLPLPASLAGYQPLALNPKDQIEKTGATLWVPVDTVAGGFFSGMSSGAFGSATPMSLYQPDVTRQAALYRMGVDPNASVVATPGSVQVSEVYAAPTPVKQLKPAVALKLGKKFNRTNQKLVLVDTKWQQTAAGAAWDQDQGLRIYPTQIHLVTTSKGGGGQPAMTPPLAFSHDMGDHRVFQPFNKVDVTAFGDRQKETFGWVFIIPADRSPRFLLVRHLRLALPKIEQDTKALVKAMGAPAPKKPKEAKAGEAGEGEGGGPSEVGGREGTMAGNVAKNIELTGKLPRVLSKNFAPGLRVRDGGVVSGKDTASKRPGSLSTKTRIERIYVPNHQVAVRVRITPDRARSLLGGARVAAASLGGVWLTDARGAKHQPIGYDLDKAGGDQMINVNRTIGAFQSARQLPIDQMDDGDKLYLYFAIPKGAKIVSYNIGSTTTQKIKPPLVAKKK